MIVTYIFQCESNENLIRFDKVKEFGDRKEWSQIHLDKSNASYYAPI